MEITYTMRNGYLIPDLESPSEQIELNHWGRLRLNHLKENRSVLYAQLLTSGKLTQHLQEVQMSMSEMHERLVQQMAQQQNLTEERKAQSPLEWAQQMNTIRTAADEMILQEIMD